MKPVSSRGCVREKVFRATSVATPFDQMTFLQCTFANIQFTMDTVRGCTFKDCVFTDCRWQHGVHRCTFIQTKLHSTVCGGGLANCVFQGCELHAVVCEDVNILRCRFARCTLRGLRARGAALTGSTFDRCELTDCHFPGVNGRSVTWRQSTLRKCRLHRATLANAVIRRVRFYSCGFQHATLTAVSISKGSFHHCSFAAAVLSHATWSFVAFHGTTVFTDVAWTSLQCIRCTFQQASWLRAQLARAEFIHCQFTTCTFQQARVSDSEFTASRTAAVTWTDALCTNVVMRPPEQVRGRVDWTGQVHATELIPWNGRDALKVTAVAQGKGFLWKGVSGQEIDFIEAIPQTSWVPFSSQTDPHEIITLIRLEGGELFRKGTRHGVEGFVRVWDRRRNTRPCAVRGLDLAIPSQP